MMWYAITYEVMIVPTLQPAPPGAQFTFTIARQRIDKAFGRRCSAPIDENMHHERGEHGR